jgi:probable HAF family extracellular repeat protein
MNPFPSLRGWSALLLAFSFFSPAYGQMHDLGVLPGGASSQGTAISGDGRVVAGFGGDALNNQWLFYWTAEDGLVNVIPFSGFGSVHAMSHDGGVLVGTLRLNGAQRAFRWDAASGVVDLGTLGGDTSRAWGTSDDGNVIVGDAVNAAAVRRAFRWTAAQGMQELPGLVASGMSIAYAVSGDGEVAVGTSASSTSGNRAVRWENGTVLDLGSLDGNAGSSALGVNADGSVVVGASGTYAFRWTAATGMLDLGSLGGFYSSAQDVSADGSVVVGNAGLADHTDRAFRWTAETGMVSLGLLSGGTYSIANGVSDDGRIIVGTADNAHGDRAFIWKDFVLQDLGHVQESVGGAANSSAQLIDSQVRRARSLGEKLCIPGATQTYCLSLGSDVTVGDGDENSRQVMGTLAGGLRLDAHVSLGASLALAPAGWQAGGARQERQLGVAAWLAYQQDSSTRTGWNAALSLASSGGDSQFDRGNRAADVEQADTRVGLRSNAVRLAVGYGVPLERSLLTPELAITHVRSRRESFAERNVVLPLRVDGSRSDVTYATLALRGETPLSARASLHWGAALDGLLNENAADFQGQSEIPGLSQFALSASQQKRDLVPSTYAGYRYALSENASVGGQAQVGASTLEGQRPVYGLEVEYRYRF